MNQNIAALISQVDALLKVRLSKHLSEAGLNISAEQFRLLSELWKSDGVNQNNLACAVGRDRGSITRMLDVLEKKGFVSRKGHPEDRRANLIFLTQKGEEAKLKAEECATKTIEEALSHLHPDEIKGLYHQMHTLLKNLE